MKILVRAPNWIGDQVLSFPFFYYLRKQYPKAHITSVCLPWVRDLQFRTLVDDVIILKKPAQPKLLDKLKVLEEAAAVARARGPYDLGISLPDSLSAAWFLFRSGVRRRRGYVADGRGLLLNESTPLPKMRVHRGQGYVDLLPPSEEPRFSVQEFWGIPPENDLDEPILGELKAFDAERFWPLSLLRKEAREKHEAADRFELVHPPQGDYWVLAPGATADSRRWPLEYFLALSRQIAQTTRLPCVIVGGPQEAPLAERLCRESDVRFIDLTARGAVPTLAEIFKHAKFTVSNESGLAHVASLCGSMVQIVCGAADPRRTQPLGPGKVQVAVNPIDCWPCEKNVCSNVPERKNLCLKGIHPETVWEEIARGTGIDRTIEACT